MARIHHKEQDFQIRCVKWFRAEYPEFAKLLEHPKNEVASGNRAEGAIAKAEGVQAGMSDLILHVPSLLAVIDGVQQEELYMFYTLAIELKTKTGRQSLEQKIIQRYLEAAGTRYVLIRSFEDFQKEVRLYISGVPQRIHTALIDLYNQIEKEQTEAARKELQKLLNK